MTYLLEEDLTSQGIYTKTSLQIKFDNRVYLRVKTLPKQFYERAEKIKKEYLSNNIDTLLIEHRNWIAIWVEQKSNELDLAEREYLYQINSKYFPPESSNHRFEDKNKKYGLDREDFLEISEFTEQSLDEKYKEIVYEDKLFEEAYSTDRAEKSTKVAKTYRGITYNERVANNKAKKEARFNQFKRKYRGYTY
ncbi:MAG: hypothetical protein AB4368_13460 [Xenococcaceae cyanobacterium]